jgi:hypothetical protein
MSIQSGIGQIPSVFSGGGGNPLVINGAFSVGLPLTNQGDSTGVGSFQYLLTGAQLYALPLVSSTTYRVVLTLTCIIDVGTAQSATLQGTPFVQFQWASPTGALYDQTLPVNLDVEMGTILVSGVITTPNLDIYNNTAPSYFGFLPSWTYPTDLTADLFTAGQLYFELV